MTKYFICKGCTENPCLLRALDCSYLVKPKECPFSKISPVVWDEITVRKFNKISKKSLK